MLQAVLFDFDGVLADSEPIHLKASQEVLASEGLELAGADYYARYLGYDDRGLFRAYLEDRGIAVEGARIEAWVSAKTLIVQRLLTSDGVLFPGAADLVKMLAERVPLAIASGALGHEIALVLDSAGLGGCFKAVASASDGVPGKPAPDLYQLAMARLSERMNGTGDLRPASCAAIEDSLWGLESAGRAGLRCIAVTHTYPASELAHADLVVERLSDLTIAAIEGLMRHNERGR
jgi:beta-phosphoglucomutase-like phosphatase (HAD superfamily)